VRDHAGGVDYALQMRTARCPELLAELRGEIAGIDSRLYLFTRAFKKRARDVDGKGIVGPARQLVDGGKVAQAHQKPSSTVS
jgi:hypothetical protein